MVKTEFSYKFENPFNVAAEWICHLRGINRQFFDNDVDRKALPHIPQMHEDVKAFLESLPNIRDSKILLRDGVPLKEKQQVQAWQHYEDFQYMLEFLCQYTRKLDFKVLESSSYFHKITHTSDGKTKEFESLNTNAEETGLQILPFIKTINDSLTPADESKENAETQSSSVTEEEKKKTWSSDRMLGIHTELSHIFYVETEKLNYNGRRYRAMHSFIGRHSFPEGKKILKIAVCPIAHEDLLNYVTYCKLDTKQGFFSITGLKDGQLVQDRIEAAFLKACEEQANIILFPEMLGTADLVSRRFFTSLRSKAAEQGYHMPELILMPTWWHENKNELYVMDAGGRFLAVQQKQNSFLYVPPKDGKNPQSCKEDLIDPEPVIHIVHIPEVGRFAFPICKDDLHEEYVRLMLRYLRATFLLCPSYSPGKTEFSNTAPGGIPYGCYTVWANTCAAYFEKKELPKYIGLANGPKATKTPMGYLIPECKGECGGRHDACVFLVEINMDRSANISYRHIHI